MDTPPFTCRRCGVTLVLHEHGTYTGSRLLTADGRIIEDTYKDDGTDCDGFEVRCPKGCTWSRDIEVGENRVTWMDE